MRSGTALSRLKDGELCLIVTRDGEIEARWSASAWCFVYLTRGVPVICDPRRIEEWRPLGSR